MATVEGKLDRGRSLRETTGLGGPTSRKEVSFSSVESSLSGDGVGVDGFLGKL